MKTTINVLLIKLLNIRRASMRKCTIILCSVLFFSCNDFLQLDPPKNELIRNAVFEDDLTTKAALSAIYSKMTGGGNNVYSGTSGSITVLGGLLSDESLLFSINQDAVQFFENSIVPNNGIVLNHWSSCYTHIYDANAILEGLINSNGVTPNLRRQVLGEAKFIRAFCHFYLVNLFGDVPYVKTTDFRVNTSVSRTSTIEVYDAIIADLKDAQELLAEDYSYSDNERIRPNKWAATALLSRVYLYMEDWIAAENEANAIINNTMLFKLPQLNNVFLKNSDEAIWQLKPVVSNRNTSEGNIFILTGTPTFSALRNEFVNDFEIGDNRKSQWVGSLTMGANTWYYPYKYKIRTGGTPLNEYSMMLRLAEQYLIRAEARAQQGKIPEAIRDLDVIRARAGVALIGNTNPSVTKENLLLLIEHERRIELFSELGHRWLDMKRTGRADAVFKTIKSNWNPTDILFPIPESEVLINRNMSQNLGY